jgi:aminoglycoside phosphotransferase (APT) family kinase protein
VSTFPTERRLLLGLQSAIQSFQALCASAEGDSIASTATAALNELMLRLDRPFYRDYVDRGLKLLRTIPPTTLDSLSETRRTLLAETLRKAEHTVVSIDTLPFEAIAQCIDDLRTCLAAAADMMKFASGESLLQDMIEWEAALYARAMAYQAEQRTQLPAITTERLEAYLRERFPEHPSLVVTSFKTLVGGFQKLTILFETNVELLGCRSFVMRAEMPDRFAPLELGAIADEYAVLRILEKMRLPVAAPLWLETDSTKLGRRFLVSRKAEGINYGAAVGVDKQMSDNVAKAFLSTLAQIHRAPLAQFERELSSTPLHHWLTYDSSSANTLRVVHYWRDFLGLRPNAASPTLEIVFKWLVENVPQEPSPLCLLHCDYAPHNVLIHDDKVSAVLDWEVARIGDPAQDLAYFLQSTEGHIDRQQALQWYQEAGGLPISDFRLRDFGVFSILQWLVGCLSANSLYATDDGARNIWIIGTNWMDFPLRLAIPRLRAAMEAQQSTAA